MTHKKTLENIKQRKRLLAFFRDCGKEQHKLQIEQGKSLEIYFPDLPKMVAIDLSLGDRCLSATEIVTLESSLRKMGIHPAIVSHYLAGEIDYDEFLELLGKAFTETTNFFQRMANETQAFITYRKEHKRCLTNK